MNEHLRKLLELNFSQGEKVKISPIGEVVGFDGRKFTINGQAVIEETQKNSVDLVLDVNHGFSNEGDAAAGWFDINSLELRDDGIYAALNQTELGEPLVSKKLYKYLSPAYIMDKNKQDRSVLSIDSVGLVNRPNLLIDELNKKQHEENVVVELNEKIEQLENEKNTFESTLATANDEIKELNTKLDESNTTIKELNTKIRDLIIDLAIEKNKILPKDKEFCKSLNDTQLNSYIQNNAGSALAKELSKNIKTKEQNNSKSRIEIAAAAGSKK